MLNLVLLVFAFVLFVIGAGIPSVSVEPYWRRIVSAGLACWVGAELFGRFVK